VVCAKPLVDALRQAHPDARLTCILKSPAESAVFAEPGLVDDFMYIDTSSGVSPLAMLRLVAAISRARFDMFVIGTDLAPVKGPLLAFLSGAAIRAGEDWSMAGRLLTHRVPRDMAEHKVDSNARIGAAIGLAVPRAPRLRFTDTELADADALLAEHGFDSSRPIVAIHPGSGPQAPHKRWPREKYVSYGASLPRDVDVLLVGGPAERVDAGFIAENLAAQRHGAGLVGSVTGRLSVRATAAVLSRCSVVVGGDSGVLHLARAAGARTVSLFGPTRPERCSPAEGDEIVRLSLPCGPCYDRTPLGCGNPICMTGIEPASVLMATGRILSPRSSKVQ
jgi:ADP-heptose:LPS heptosyltransferase